MHGAKNTKNQIPCHVLLRYFITRPSLKNLYTFLTKKDAKIVLTFEIRPLVAELKLKT